MRVLSKREMPQIAPLFAALKETMILSCLQGIMGSAVADRLPEPRCARIDVGDFSFISGDPGASGAAALVSESRPLLVSLQPDWETVIRAACPDAKPFQRYAIKKEPDVFDLQKLRAFAETVPEGYRVMPMDEELFCRCRELPWAMDFCSLFDSWSEFAQMGLGWLALKDGELAAGASSYSVYREGIEIQIETAPEHRRRGLALCCGARLILSCLERGLYPSWDAANLISVALAEKLGYHLQGSYVTWKMREVRP